ncbi:MAG: hypothetical protein GEV03_28560 [Streptosporangiales bacterium]|nr:hypothetical protein [Streptosporangiales bacterium]
MGHGGAGDIHVKLERLQEYAGWCQEHLDSMEEFLASSGRGALREARDGTKFGGFEAAQNLASMHAQLTEDMRRLLYQIRDGLETAKSGVEQMAKNYSGVDDQRSRKFSELDETADNL